MKKFASYLLGPQSGWLIEDDIEEEKELIADDTELGSEDAEVADEVVEDDNKDQSE